MESGTVTKVTLDALHSQIITFGKDTIPTVEAFGQLLRTDRRRYVSSNGFSQSSGNVPIQAEHPIRGVQILRRLCKLYGEPKFYFVVPPHRFAAFKKQSFKAKTGTDDVAEIRKLKQYVLELPVI